MPELSEPEKEKIENEHLDWFFNLDQEHVLALMKEWNESKLGIKLKKKRNYDEWLNYFKTMPASHIRMLTITGQDILNTEAFSALRRWADIINNPSRIDKIHQAGLSGKKKKTSISYLAQQNDRLGVLKATRDKIAEKLDRGVGNRDTAALTAQMTEIMTQIADYEKRLGPKADTPLGKLFADMPNQQKRPSKNGGGSRNTSFKTRVTIDDLEDNNG